MGLKEPFYTVYPFIQASRSRQENLLRLGQIIEAEGVPGVVMECGVLDGGSSALMAYATRASARPVHLFDAWQGLPATTAEDTGASDKWVGDVVGSPARVRQVMEELGIDPKRLHVHRGWFHETFPQAVKEIDQIALLHLDCDFYEPMKLCLETWYPKLSPGGYIQIDDYIDFAGGRQATDAFLASTPGLKLEFWGERGAATFFRKPVA
jgi:O-methyltransferase